MAPTFLDGGIYRNELFALQAVAVYHDRPFQIDGRAIRASQRDNVENDGVFGFLQPEKGNVVRAQFRLVMGQGDERGDHQERDAGILRGFQPEEGGFLGTGQQYVLFELLKAQQAKGHFDSIGLALIE